MGVRRGTTGGGAGGAPGGDRRRWCADRARGTGGLPGLPHRDGVGRVGARRSADHARPQPAGPGDDGRDGSHGRVPVHLDAAGRAGVSDAEVDELLFQITAYCGAPAGSAALSVLCEARTARESV
ncbi:carboxymuconolactone decarboxylase family protein [Streptomyces sp. NPDC014986]|uniref:carboxymuconolactone decarboxylase family protein n=1 Tax=Streptomyces sp. NPDC014986 TaxID=3364934 RepID=UPI0036F52378